MTTNKQRIADLLEANGIPVAAVAIAVGVATSLGDAVTKLGWRVFAIVVLVACCSWAVYVWTAKRPNLIDPAHLVPKFGRAPRVVALVTALVSVTPVGYSLRQTSEPVPRLIIKVRNPLTTPVEILEYGEAFFSVPESPVMDRLVETRRIKLTAIQPSTNFIVPPGTDRWFSARFLNDSALLEFLKREDVALTVLVNTKDGEMLHKDGVAFTREELTTRYVLLEVTQPVVTP